MSSARKRAAIQKANNEAEFLRQRLMRAEHQVDKVTAMAFATAQKYDQLLFAVGRKFRDESRHETALRYIREAENAAIVGDGCTAAMGSNVELTGAARHGQQTKPQEIEKWQTKRRPLAQRPS